MPDQIFLGVQFNNDDRIVESNPVIVEKVSPIVENESPQCGLFDDADYISVYTATEMLADGLLVDLSESVRRFGITCPFLFTKAVNDKLDNIKALMLQEYKSDALINPRGHVLWQAVKHFFNAIEINRQMSDPPKFEMTLYNRAYWRLEFDMFYSYMRDGIPCVIIALRDERFGVCD